MVARPWIATPLTQAYCRTAVGRRAWCSIRETHPYSSPEKPGQFLMTAWGVLDAMLSMATTRRYKRMFFDGGEDYNHKKRLLKFVCGFYTTQVSRAGRLTTYRKTTLIHHNVLTGKRGKMLVVVHEIPRWSRGNARGSAHAVLSSCRRARGLADDLDGLKGWHGGRF